MVQKIVDKTFHVSSPIKSRAVLHGVGKTRMGFAIQHLMAAARFSRLCKKVEIEHQGQPIDSFFDEIISSCTASIFLSVASLEAHINDIVFDSKINFPNHDQQLVEEIFKIMERTPILQKYQMVLALRGATKFNQKKDKVYLNAYILTKLRNALVHFKPEWEDEQKDHKKIGENLRNKFDMSPFLAKNEPIFPKRFISHGCAKWSVETVTNFIDAFHKKANLANKYNLFRQSLNPT